MILRRPRISQLLRLLNWSAIRPGAGLRGYEWSSAEAHLSGEDSARIADISLWGAAGGAATGARLLSEPEVGGELEGLRRATHSGLPFGDQAFKKEMHAQRAELWAKGACEQASRREVEVPRAIA
jgi:hypothetical protein